MAPASTVKMKMSDSRLIAAPIIHNIHALSTDFGRLTGTAGARSCSFRAGAAGMGSKGLAWPGSPGSLGVLMGQTLPRAYPRHSPDTHLLFLLAVKNVMDSGRNR